MNNSIKRILIGADPEMFLRDRKTGKMVTAIGRVGGTKEEPLPVHLGALQEDGTAAEININPASNAEEFIFNLEAVMTALQGKVGDDIELVCNSYVTFDKDQLQNELAWAIGCDPDIDAWTGLKNTPPRNYKDGTRVAGGHVHIGYDKPTEETSFKLVQMCDYLVGLPALLHEPDVFRRTLYGKAGSCRIKPYGVEYRALGNFWLKDAELMRWVYDQTILAVQNLDKLELLKETLNPGLLQDLINFGENPTVIEAYYDSIKPLVETKMPTRTKKAPVEAPPEVVRDALDLADELGRAMRPRPRLRANPPPVRVDFDGAVRANLDAVVAREEAAQRPALDQGAIEAQIVRNRLREERLRRIGAAGGLNIEDLFGNQP